MTDDNVAARSSVGREMATGATWMLAFKATERSLSLVSTIVLARALLPSDFGMLAMALSLSAILDLLTSFSFDVALIQRREAKREYLDTAWTLNIIFAVLVFVLMLALADAAAAYYHEPQLKGVIYALAFAWLVQGFENIGIVGFRREMRFEKEYRFLALKKAFGVLVTLPLALALHSYWALVIGVIASRIFSVALSFRMHPFRPRLSLARAGNLLGFSAWLLANNILLFFNQRVTDFIVGRIAGAQALGLFNISLEISNLPTTEIAAPINRAMLPGYSRIAREQGQLGRFYLDTLGVMALFTVPAGLGIAAVADPLVRVLLGAKWVEAIPLIQVLAVYGAIHSIGNNSGAAMMALGRPNLLVKLAALRLTLLIPALLYATSNFGYSGAAWAILLVTMFMTPVSFAVFLPQLRVRASEFLAHIWRPAAASAGMYFMVGASIEWLRAAGIDIEFLQLFAALVVGCLSYLSLVVGLWVLVGRPRGAERLSYEWISARLRAFFAFNA